MTASTLRWIPISNEEMNTDSVSNNPEARRVLLVRRGLRLEALTLVWNVVGVAVLSVAAIASRSIGLTAFGLDTLIEIGASTVVIWELRGTQEDRTRRALRLLGIAFTLLASYLIVQGFVALLVAHRPSSSPLGIVWTGATALAMFALARGKSKTGAELENSVLVKESRVTVVDGLLALAVLAGLVLTSTLGWGWVDPMVGFVLAAYAAREAWELLGE